jgi:hypothetical protein
MQYSKPRVVTVKVVAQMFTPKSDSPDGAGPA